MISPGCVKVCERGGIGKVKGKGCDHIFKRSIVTKQANPPPLPPLLERPEEVSIAVQTRQGIGLLDCPTPLFFSGYLAFMMNSNSDTLILSYREKHYSPRDTEIGY